MPTLKARIGGAWVPVAGGSDEVVISPDDPIASFPGTELWYDSDAPAILTDDLRWNTAWGRIGGAVCTTAQTGLTLAGPGVVLTGSAFIPTVIFGRRYRLSLTCAPVVSDTTTSLIYNIRHNGATVHTRAISGAVLASSNTMTTFVEWNQPNTNSSTTMDVTFYRQSGSGTVGNYADTSVVTYFTLDDIGPVAGAVPAPNPTPGWIAPTLLNGWVNSGGAHQVAQYRLMGDKVELRGRINLGTMNTSIFVLPAGYRPQATVTMATGSVVSGNWAFGVVEVTTDGSVATYAPGSNQGVVLNNLSFSVSA